MRTPSTLLTAFLLGCTSAATDATDAKDSAAPEALVPKVLLIGIDGLRGDALASADTPSMDRMIDEGAWSLTASTQLASATVSGPGWTSMLTGVDSDKHGISMNGGYTEINRFYPTLIGRAHELGLSTATAIYWIPIQMSLIESGSIDEFILGDDDPITEEMVRMLQEGTHDVHFLALDDVDYAGHRSAFVPEEPSYRAAVEVADTQVGRVLDAIEARPTRAQEQWLVALTADHGGDADGHGTLNAENRTIPLLLWGDGLVLGELPGESISHMDAHPTLMAHLGYPPQDHWNLDGAVRGLQTP